MSIAFTDFCKGDPPRMPGFAVFGGRRKLPQNSAEATEPHLLCFDGTRTLPSNAPPTLSALDISTVNGVNHGLKLLRRPPVDAKLRGSQIAGLALFPWWKIFPIGLLLAFFKTFCFAFLRQRRLNPFEVLELARVCAVTLRDRPEKFRKLHR